MDHQLPRALSRPQLGKGFRYILKFIRLFNHNLDLLLLDPLPKHLQVLRRIPNGVNFVLALAPSQERRQQRPGGRGSKRAERQRAPNLYKLPACNEEVIRRFVQVVGRAHVVQNLREYLSFGTQVLADVCGGVVDDLVGTQRFDELGLGR